MENNTLNRDNALTPDFSVLHNPDLAEYCYECFCEKQEVQHVTDSYIRVLFTAVRHYDDFLCEHRYTDYGAYDSERKLEYESYLEKLTYGKSRLPLTDKYIRFLSLVPSLLFREC